MTWIAIVGVLVSQSASSITVTIEGLPEGCRPKVTIGTPSGNEDMDPATPWTATAPGAYSVTGDPFRHQGDIVDVVYDAASVSTTLKAGKAEALVLRYRPRPGTGMLWTVAERINEETDDFTEGEVRALNASSLTAGGFSTGSRLFKIPSRAFGGAVLPDGSLMFAGGWDDGAVLRILSAQLGGGGQRTKLDGHEPAHVSVDPRGRIWLHGPEFAKCFSGPNFTAKPLVELRPDEVAPISFENILFDRDGSMVVYGRGHIQRIPAASLSGSRTIAKNGVTTESGTVSQAALDRAGNLWMTDENGMVHKFSKQPSGSFAGDSTEFPAPQSVVGLAIDESESIWILVRYTGELMRLKKDGSAFEAVGTFGRGHSPGSRLAFNPPASWSPLADAPGFVKTRLP